MSIASFTLSIPLALDGESMTSSNTGIAILSLVSMVGCYVLLAALWYFVFRDKSRSKRGKDSSD
ncbi:MAG: hypothetical protein ACYDHN_02020 [Solirubrobacteraceae bacterium]